LALIIDMNEYIAYLIIYLVFAFFSFLFYKFAVNAKSIWAFLIVIGYFVIIYWVFDFFNDLHHYLRNRGFYIDFGHASLGLLIMMFFCYINAAIVIFLTLYRRQKRKAVRNHS